MQFYLLVGMKIIIKISDLIAEFKYFMIFNRGNLHNKRFSIGTKEFTFLLFKYAKIFYLYSVRAEKYEIKRR